MRPENFDVLAEKLRNWGRWGAEDQRGTLNHIGPAGLKAAAETVQSGKLFNLGLNFDKNGPQLGAGRFNPKLYVTDLFTALNPAHPSAVYSDDVIHMPLQAATPRSAPTMAGWRSSLAEGLNRRCRWRSTCCACATWAARWARCSTSKPWRPTAPRTGATPSCWPRRPWR